MTTDSVERIMQAWRERDPHLDSSSLAISGRLVLSAEYYERTVVSVLNPFGLSIADFDVLNTLRRVGDQRGSKPSEMARSSLITTGAMTSRLDRLEQAGLIRRDPDPSDRRGVLVRLTARGRSVAKRALEKLIAANKEFFSPLTERQRDSVASALKQLLLHHERP